MTREDIEKALKERQMSQFGGGYIISHGDMINFALDMVRRHNEECQKIARKRLFVAIADEIERIRP